MRTLISTFTEEEKEGDPRGRMVMHKAIVLGRISGFGYETRTGPAIRRSPVSIQRMAPRLAVGYGFEISRKMGCRPSKSLEFSEMDAVSVAGRYVHDVRRYELVARQQLRARAPSGWRA